MERRRGGGERREGEEGHSRVALQEQLLAWPWSLLSGALLGAQLPG